MLRYNTHMKNMYFVLLSLIIFLLGYALIGAIVFGLLQLQEVSVLVINPILKLKPYLTSATVASFIAPFSLFATYPLAFKLGRYLISKKRWELANITKLLAIALSLYLFPSVILLILHLLPR